LKRVLTNGDYGLIFFGQMAAIFGIFYLILIRPQRKEQERHKKMLEQVKKGDEVITSGGIIGKVIHAQEDRLTIKTGEDTRIVVDRRRLAQVVSDASPEA
jgi:preprotein translocase subunit YajC